ncbi:MAG: methyltransferase domain-containing protein [Deltaproteobacteria bacterium]|nr:methyltransferase domain-containing protein [Deltaproteobacteria bacterium]
MRKALLDILICPRCLPQEYRLQETISEGIKEDIIEGTLTCHQCGAVYPIRQGVAFLDPNEPAQPRTQNRYETTAVVASYLWSHYGDLLGDELATDAYTRWAGLMAPGPGACLDTGCAVGRFSFEMAQKFDFVVGLDNSHAFIRTSRELLRQRRLELALPEEGLLKRPETLVLPDSWRTDNLEFIVGDAQALPFAAGTFAAISSLNMVDKLPQPLVHLAEINRSAKKIQAQFLFSDPFSWSPDVAPEVQWLGGKMNGRFSGRARDNIIALLEGKTADLSPAWKVERDGPIWWKIRTHSNHYEMIRSCFIKATR